MQVPSAEIVLDRMVRAVQDVRDRLLRATAALDAAGVAYAVVGECAVAAWVAAVDKFAVRNTPTIEILIRRADLPGVVKALGVAGFAYMQSDDDGNRFLDGPEARERDAVRILFVGEKRRPQDAEPNPDVESYVLAPPYRILNLGPLVRMSLASFRTIDRVGIRDLIDVGLVADWWPDSFPPTLAGRLREIQVNPDD
jgi:hypothetical protein